MLPSIGSAARLWLCSSAALREVFSVQVNCRTAFHCVLVADPLFYSQVPLGVDSLVTFFERRSHMIIRENTFEDGGPCQIFGGLYHAVIAENTLVRSDGIIVEGLENTQGPMVAAVRAEAPAAQPDSRGDVRAGTHAGVRHALANPPLPDIQYPTYIPTYFIEVLDNVILEGNVYGGGTGGFVVSGAFNSSSPYSGAMAAAVVLRNNSGSNAYFQINDAVSDVIVEGNSLIDSDTGLQLHNQSGTNPMRVFIGSNLGL